MDEQKLRLLDDAKSLSYSGLSKEEIFTKLNAKDLGPEMTKHMLSVIDDAQIELEVKEQIKAAGLNKIFFGAVLFLFGLGITYVYYTANNIAYYIMIGMIVGGPYLSFIGYRQYSKPISEELSEKNQRIKKSKFKKY